MDFQLAQKFLLWLKEVRDDRPEYFLDTFQPSEREQVHSTFVDMAQDLLDDKIIESSMKSGWGAEEADLPIRVRLTDLGRRIVRNHDGRIDAWVEEERRSSSSSGMNLTVHGDVTGSQLGVGHRVSQTQDQSTNSTSHQALALLERALVESRNFDLEDEDRDDLEDAARAGIRELKEADDSATADELPSGAKRRMKKVAAILGGLASRIATSVATTAGDAAAQEISDGLHQLMN